MLLMAGMLCGMGSSQANQTDQTHQQIRSTLSQAGLHIPIQDIKPSPVAGIHQLTMADGASLLISDDLGYVMRGPFESNPSPRVAIDLSSYTPQAPGTYISKAHKKALLDNMTDLKSIHADTAFFHTGMPGLIWGMTGLGGNPFLISTDGRYLLNGEIGRLKNGVFSQEDLDFIEAKNRQILQELSDQDLAIYPAQGQELAIVYVATDINCPYCKIFHNKISQYNAQGITVKAIGFPIYDESLEPMNQIWCQADNQQRALLLSAAMKGIQTKTQDCSSRLLTVQQQASALDVLATPAIFNNQGQLFMGDFTKDEFYRFLGL